MRRKDREITDETVMDEIIKNSDICYLGLSENDHPYVVPMNFGFQDNCVYYHCANSGKKLDMIRQNPKVCLTFTSDYEICTEGEVQTWTTRYRSVIAFGIAEVIIDPAAKQYAVNVLLSKYTDKNHEFSQKTLNSVSIIKVAILEKTGKANWS